MSISSFRVEVGGDCVSYVRDHYMHCFFSNGVRLRVGLTSPFFYLTDAWVMAAAEQEGVISALVLRSRISQLHPSYYLI